MNEISSSDALPTRFESSSTPHPPPLHSLHLCLNLYLCVIKVQSPSCFDLCYQSISCVRLMFFFFSGYSGFPIHPLGCLELDFCSSFSKVGLYLGRIVYYSCIIFNSVSSRFVPLFHPPPSFCVVVLFLTHSNYCVIVFTSRPSPFLV